MDKIRFFESYVAAVHTGSLTAAARQQKISQPAISQQISALEDSYSTKLLHRTRNGVTVTRAGSVFFRRALSILKEHNELKEELSQFNKGVDGQLKISTNVGISQFIMLDVLNELSENYPELKVILSSEDRMVDLVAENFDLAIRSGSLGDENVVGRRIGALEAVLVASPTYLDQNMRPQTPDELQQLNYIQYRADDDMIAMPLQNGEEMFQAPIKSNLTAQLPSLVFQALENNMGYAKSPFFMVADAIKQNKLETVLPDYRLPAKDLYLVYPLHESNTHRMKVFLQTLIKRLTGAPGIQILPAVQKEFRTLQKV